MEKRFDLRRADDRRELAGFLPSFDSRTIDIPSRPRIDPEDRGRRSSATIHCNLTRLQRVSGSPTNIGQTDRLGAAGKLTAMARRSLRKICLTTLRRGCRRVGWNGWWCTRGRRMSSVEGDYGGGHTRQSEARRDHMPDATQSTDAIAETLAALWSPLLAITTHQGRSNGLWPRRASSRAWCQRRRASSSSS
jgi:hypothetical protein